MDASFEDDPRKWWALTALVAAQAMLILDIAIVNIAVPSAQADLHISPADAQWVVTAYLLPFGGLLLLGGRIADYAGRKRVFCAATIGFAVASGLGGAAGSADVLFAARALQGLFAAAMAPALLSMLSLGFPRDPDRTRAFAVYGGVSAAGGAFGLVIGGLLTEYLSWRWCLLVNVPLSAVVIAAALPLLRESRAPGGPSHDATGALLGTLGLLGVIYGIANVAQEGWLDTWTVLPTGAGLAVIAAFLAWEARTRHPLVPLEILRDRSRAGGLLALSVVYGPGAGFVLLMLIVLQGPLREGALSAGLHFAPIPVAAGIAAVLTMRLTPVVSPRALVAAGTVVGGAGLVAATRVGADASFATDMLPAFTLYGAGAAVLFVVGNAVALQRVRDDDAALVSAISNTMQQVGAALGVAILASVAAQAAGDALTPEAVIHGMHVACLVGAALMIGAGALAAWLIVVPAAAPPVDDGWPLGQEALSYSVSGQCKPAFASPASSLSASPAPARSAMPKR